MKLIKEIVDTKQYADVDGFMVDLYSANVVMQIYNALGDENRVKFENLTVKAMVALAYRCIK
jgi:acyl-CoA synthetase (NDP forming)